MTHRPHPPSSLTKVIASGQDSTLAQDSKKHKAKLIVEDNFQQNNSIGGPPINVIMEPELTLPMLNTPPDLTSPILNTPHFPSGTLLYHDTAPLDPNLLSMTMAPPPHPPTCAIFLS